MRLECPRSVLALWITACAAACQSQAAWSGEPPSPDRAMFEEVVYPILLRDCAFSECHGAPQRFFQVFGPGRSRLPGHPSDPDLVPREKAVSYERAAAMLVTPHPGALLRAPLLTKPLELVAGGAAHEGVDVFGRNVFRSTTDPRYQVLLAWASSHDLGVRSGGAVPQAGGAAVPASAGQPGSTLAAGGGGAGDAPATLAAGGGGAGGAPATVAAAGPVQASPLAGAGGVPPAFAGNGGRAAP